MDKLLKLKVLIKEALQRSNQLGSPYEGNLSPDFLQVLKNLEDLPDQQSQQALIISAARRQIDQAEKLTVALIIGDDPITGNQMSHLVRIRLICAELMNLLSAMLEQIQMRFLQPRTPGRSMTGA